MLQTIKQKNTYSNWEKSITETLTKENPVMSNNFKAKRLIKCECMLLYTGH